MHIRPYSIEDLRCLVNIYNASKLDELKREDQRFTLIPLLDDSKRLKLFNASEKFVFDKEGIRGFIGIINNHISFLYVAKQHRGKSIAKALLNYVILHNKQDLTLDVTQSNNVAQGLYKSVGFSFCNAFEGNYNGKAVVVHKLKRKQLGQ